MTFTNGSDPILTISDFYAQKSVLHPVVIGARSLSADMISSPKWNACRWHHIDSRLHLAQIKLG